MEKMLTVLVAQYRPDPQALRRTLASLAMQATRDFAVVLADGPELCAPKFYLLREKTGERVEISRSPFLVGVETGSVDYCVTGNPAVSRKHQVSSPIRPSDRSQAVSSSAGSTPVWTTVQRYLLPFVTWR